MNYKKVLELARNIYGAYENKDILTTLEAIFPELKESEDNERIRKSIIALLDFGLESNSAVAPGSNITKEMTIVWIEKQRKIEGSFINVDKCAESF